MPDLIIVSSDVGLSARLNAVANECGFRVKETTKAETVIDWLGSKSFDVILLDPSLSKSQIESISNNAWSVNPQTVMVVAALNLGESPELSRRRFEWDLMGLGFVQGAQGVEDLRSMLIRISSSKLKPGKPFRVMVVEDLDAPRDIICSFVEHIGYPSVQGFSSAKAAVSELESTPGKFSCIITDINMPEMNGKELIHAIRANKKLEHLPIIVLTAYGTVDNLIDCLEKGASGFLVKPPSKNDLNRELNRALRIVEQQYTPRLASKDEVEHLRDVLVEKGFQ